MQFEDLKPNSDMVNGVMNMHTIGVCLGCCGRDRGEDAGVPAEDVGGHGPPDVRGGHV